MARPPIGSLPMTHTVKFRLDDVDLSDLHDIRDGRSVSETIRALIKAEKKRRSRRAK